MNPQSALEKDFQNVQTKLEHVVLTRFNVRYTQNPTSISIGNDPRWLRHRFELFEKYCLPCLIQQRNQDFTWLIFFDNDTPPAFSARARELVNSRPRTHIIFCDSLPIERVREEISKHITTKPEWLLSTRIDNDDGIHNEFLSSVRDAAKHNFAHVINVPVGLILKARRTYVHRHESNAFISLFEPYSLANTVFSITRHIDAAKNYPVFQSGERALWLQVIHGKNISNRIRGRRVRLTDVANGFPPLEQLGEINERQYQLTIENLTIGIGRSLFEKITPVVKLVGARLGFDLRKKVKEHTGRKLN
jgi:hypothetical protein